MNKIEHLFNVNKKIEHLFKNLKSRIILLAQIVVKYSIYNCENYA